MTRCWIQPYGVWQRQICANSVALRPQAGLLDGNRLQNPNYVQTSASSGLSYKLPAVVACVVWREPRNTRSCGDSDDGNARIRSPTPSTSIDWNTGPRHAGLSHTATWLDPLSTGAATAAAAYDVGATRVADA